MEVAGATGLEPAASCVTGSPHNHSRLVFIPPACIVFLRGDTSAATAYD